MFELFSQAAAFIVGLYFSLFGYDHTAATKCGQSNDIQYCYYQGSPESSRVVYFLHGFANDYKAWSWNLVTERIEKEWKKSGKRPHVVSVSFGQIWWYSPEKGAKLSAFVPQIEKELGLSKVDRAVYGDSMGGHNSFRWAADHPQLFRKMALICPAMPLSFAKEVKKETSGFWPAAFAADLLIKDLYAREKVQNPLQNSAYFESLKAMPEIMVIVTKKDHLGFYPGGVDLVEALKRNVSTKVVLEEQDIDHCKAEASGLAQFLAL